jgi:hypothetical protein
MRLLDSHVDIFVLPEVDRGGDGVSIVNSDMRSCNKRDQRYI